eukprot:gnl/TRDRNA2_/TRDRNA2_177479_c1_seq5.p1 gnl/TRDRNA2_/TRDRNA2_177479_c1~~gnl/TRDRNA2_/TRDRNA2_177479_c1_seq5.p1  ORF type:complete len:546 (+),score=53.76 gnl/TRDRNA2_/TRDRNA2_177479_c1_seq5:592-2229(+)
MIGRRWSLFFLSGMHSSAILTYYCVTLGDDDHTVTMVSLNMICTSVMILGGGAVFEYCIASLWRALEEQRKATERLLDHASDGFCSINLSTGVITAASPQLALTLKTTALSGHPFIDFLEQSDRVSLQNLFMRASTLGELQPILVTCLLHTTDGPEVLIDTKLIPFSSSRQRINLCIQVQGEPRLSQREGATAAMSTNLASLFETETVVDHPHTEFTLSLTRSSKPELVEVGTQTDFTRPFLTVQCPGKPSCTDVGVQAAISCRPPPLPRPATISNPGCDSSLESSSDSVEVQLMATRPMLDAFRLTSERAQKASLDAMMKQWNVARTSNMCCPWHAAVRTAKKHFKEISRTPCDPLWSPYTDWQCEGCTCLNERLASRCGLCNRRLHIERNGSLNLGRASVAAWIKTVDADLPVYKCTPAFTFICGPLAHSPGTFALADAIVDEASFMDWYQDITNDCAYQAHDSEDSEDSNTKPLKCPGFPLKLRHWSDTSIVLEATCVVDVSVEPDEQLETDFPGCEFVYLEFHDMNQIPSEASSASRSVEG